MTGLTDTKRRAEIDARLERHVFAALELEGYSDADMIGTYEELTALQSERDAIDAKARDKVAACALVPEAAAIAIDRRLASRDFAAEAGRKPKRAGRAPTITEGRALRQNDPRWGESVANYIRALPNLPKTAPPPIHSALAAALWLFENGVRESSHLSRIIGRNKTYCGVLISRVRKITGAPAARIGRPPRSQTSRKGIIK